MKPKDTRREEILKIRAEISDTDTIKQIKKPGAGSLKTLKK